MLNEIDNVSWSPCGEKELTLDDDDDDDLLMLLLVVLIETSMADAQKVIVMVKTITLAVLASNGCKYSFL